MSEVLNGLMGAVVGGLIVIVGQYLLVESQRKRDADYAAIRLISVLEEYFERCVEVVLDDGTFQGEMLGRTNSGEPYRDPRVVAPPAIAYPEDVNWKSLPSKLMFRAFQLSNAAIAADRVIAKAGEDDFPPDYEEFFSARREEYARLGIESVKLAREFRRIVRVATERRSYSAYDPDPEEYLREVLQEAEARRLSI